MNFQGFTMTNDVLKIFHFYLFIKMENFRKKKIRIILLYKNVVLEIYASNLFINYNYFLCGTG